MLSSQVMGNHRYQQIKDELLKVLLGTRSTSEVSQTLGYSFDQVRRWQTGAKELRWDEFCQLCEVLKVPLLTTITEIFLIMPDELGDGERFVGQLKARIPRESLRTLQENLGVNTSVLKRYFRGEVFPPLEFVLQMIDLNANLLGSFVLRLINTRHITPLHEIFRRSQSEVQVAMFCPIAVGIEGLLNIEEYKALPAHDPLWVCRKLGISTDEYESAWRQMVESGRVVPAGPKFAITYNTINTSGSTPEQICRMADYWTERARVRFDTPSGKPIRKSAIPGFVAYRIVPMSKSGAMKATEIMAEAFTQILALAEKNEEPYEDVRVFVMHSFSVEDAPSVEVSQSADRGLVAEVVDQNRTT